MASWAVSGRRRNLGRGRGEPEKEDEAGAPPGLDCPGEVDRDGDEDGDGVEEVGSGTGAERGPSGPDSSAPGVADGNGGILTAEVRGASGGEEE